MEEKLLNQFKNYVYTFDIEDKSIKRKYDHSIRVMTIAKNIAISKNLSEHEIVVATIAGLLHDYGRFMQWQNYHTYSDINSIDHGDLGVELLFQNNEIKNFYDDERDYQDIYDAIKYHNKYDVPASVKNQELCKIIRDADKIDILKQVSEDTSLMEECDEKITPLVIEIFYSNKPVNYKDIKNKNDKILLLLGMIYDINYEYSKNVIKENNYIEKTFNRIQNKNRFSVYFEYIKKYIN